MVYLKKNLAFATLASSVLAFALTHSAAAADNTVAVGTGTYAEKETGAARLADRFSEIAGSRANALAVVDGLRSGKGATLEGVAVSGTGHTMGYGNINIAMSLAQSQLGAAATSKDFLGALDAVMDMRADGKGWGQIAHSLGVNLGQVMGSSKHGQSVAHGAAASRASGAAKVADAGTISGNGKSVTGQGATAMSGEGKGGGNGGGSGGGNGGGGGGGNGGGKK